MKRKLCIAGIVLVFIVGLGVMVYPYVSSMINNMNLRTAVSDYEEKVEQLNKTDYSQFLHQAKIYNKSLTNGVIITDPFDEKAYKAIGKSYKTTMDIDGKGLIGYVEIPKIDVILPINHGTDTEVLSKSAGHLMNTSMPIGGKSTHSVISAHSGYPGRTFFDYLTDMEIGDSFYIKVLDKTLQYEVDQIKVIKPENTSDLRIISGEDHVTLLTCTPYGINTHRLLVRGKRVPYVKEQKEIVNSYSDPDIDYFFFLGYKVKYVTAILCTVAFVGLIALSVFLALRKKKKTNSTVSHTKEVDSDG